MKSAFFLTLFLGLYACGLVGKKAGEKKEEGGRLGGEDFFSVEVSLDLTSALGLGLSSGVGGYEVEVRKYPGGNCQVIKNNVAVDVLQTTDLSGQNSGLYTNAQQIKIKASSRDQNGVTTLARTGCVIILKSFNFLSDGTFFPMAGKDFDYSAPALNPFGPSQSAVFTNGSSSFVLSPDLMLDPMDVSGGSPRVSFRLKRAQSSQSTIVKSSGGVGVSFSFDLIPSMFSIDPFFDAVGISLDENMRASIHIYCSDGYSVRPFGYNQSQGTHYCDGGSNLGFFQSVEGSLSAGLFLKSSLPDPELDAEGFLSTGGLGGKSFQGFSANNFSPPLADGRSDFLLFEEQGAEPIVLFEDYYFVLKNGESYFYYTVRFE